MKRTASPKAILAWNWALAILTSIAVLLMAIFGVGMMFLINLADNGASGTEYMAILLIPFLLLAVPFALVALVVATLHLRHVLDSKLDRLVRLGRIINITILAIIAMLALGSFS